jgi:hypothetical protein
MTGRDSAMFNTSIIEVVIGLIFVFSLLAILVTQINGIITSAVNLRAKQLKKGLQDLVTDPQMQARLLAHPIINMVPIGLPPQVQLTAQAAEQINASEETQVNYIPPSTFVEAMIGILRAASDKTLYRALQEAINKMPSCAEKSQLREMIQLLRLEFSEATLRDMRRTIDKVTDESCREELLLGLEEVEAKLGTIRFQSSQLFPLLNALQEIDEPRFRAALETILATARNLEDAQQKLENWFNDGMERVSEAFRRRLQYYSIAVALVLALLLNVDTIHLSRVLWEDADLRQSVAAAAREFDQSPFVPQEDSPSAPLPETDNDNGEELSALAEIGQEVEATGDTVQLLLDLQLPIGWQYSAITPEMVEASSQLGLPDPLMSSRNVWNLLPGNSPNWLTLWIQKLIGLAATTIAASQGAPFWFDLLNRLTRR